MSSFLEISLIISAFIVIFPLFWMFVIWIIGRVGGWHRLAKSYGTDRTLTGDDFRWKSIRFGLLSSYSNSVNITISFEGIYLQPVIFFRAGHKPLLIPWDVIASYSQTKMGFLSGTTLNIEPHDGSKPVALTLYGAQVAESIQRNAPMSLNHGDEFA